MFTSFVSRSLTFSELIVVNVLLLFPLVISQYLIIYLDWFNFNAVD